jgi:heat shock protein HslJ
MGECQGNVVVVDIHGGNDEVGSCNRQEECYATIRSQKPIDSNLGVELCGCYAASSTAPFDECEGNVESCAMAKCMNTCEGLEAYCDLAAREENGMGELGECKLRLMEESEPMIIESMSMTEDPMSLIIDGIINGGSMSMNIDASASMSFQDNETPSQLPDYNIFETTWKAHYIDLDVDIVAPITLEFDSESVYGSAGCNKYSGGVVNFTDNSFTTKGYFATTRMYCAEVGVMEQEDAFLDFLQDKTFSYEIVDTHLNLDSQNGVTAQFVADI